MQPPSFSAASHASTAGDCGVVRGLPRRSSSFNPTSATIDPAVSWCKTALAAGELKEMIGKILE